MRRVVILGNAGSGKSTLARRLGERLGLPVVHLDVLFWEPGWVKPDNEVFRDRVRAAIVGDAWITEGNYISRTFDLRLPKDEMNRWAKHPEAAPELLAIGWWTDEGDYYRVPLDARSLRYAAYFEEGQSRTVLQDDYTSQNTVRMDIDATKQLLMHLPEIRALLGAGVR